MTSEISGSDSDLDLATMEALRGTDELQKRLFLELSSGVPSIADLAYAVKLRVKEDFKLVEKVKRKREIESKPKYCVSDVRDVVGLRIVTLYRLDALEILPLLLDKIESGRQDINSVFTPQGIEEVIIYSTNPTGDAQDLPGRVQALCESFDLGDRTRIEQTPQNYTSIHIVVWCRGRYRNEYRSIPLEIQIRTAFEDVWGEIDHGLKYKREINSGSIHKEAEARFETGLAHLNVMKTLIDGLAQYGDQIKIQLDEYNASRVRSITSKLAEPPLERLKAIGDLDDHALAIVGNAVGSGRLAMGDPAETGLQKSKQRAERHRAGNELRRAIRKIEGLDLPVLHKKECLYVLNMELALVLFDTGNELGGGAGNLPLIEANRIYAAMSDAHPDRAIILYRAARVLDALGDRRSARKKYETMISTLAVCDLPPKHWARCAVYRQMGVSYWTDGQEKMSDPTEGDRQLSASEDFWSAFHITLEGIKTQIDSEPDPVNLEYGTERDKLDNNLLYYAIDFLNTGGDPARLTDVGYSKEKLLDLVAALEGATQGRPDHRAWDTLRHAYTHFGMLDKAAASAKQVIQILQKRDIAEDASSLRDHELLSKAAESIAIEEPLNGLEG